MAIKRKIKIIASCLVTVCLILTSLKYLTDVTERKDSDYKYQPFFDQKEDFDVLFLGTSHMMNAVYPMELWNDYGIVSYNFGGNGNTLPTTYWVMENALDYTTPKVMVIDCFLLSTEEKTSPTSFSYVHQSLDAFPLSLTKVKAVLDLMNDPVSDESAVGSKNGEERGVMNLLWDFSVYHTRWSQIEQDDFDPEVTKEKGAKMMINVSTPEEYQKISSDTKLEEETVGMEYLRKMIEDCQARGIEVLLTFLPFPANEEKQAQANTVYDIAEEYGVDYINFLDEDVVDLTTDCYDSDSHLNASGARKVTDYLGQYIMEHYDVSDQRENEAYAGWNEDYQEYEAIKTYRLQNQSELDLYLMLLADQHYDTVIEVGNTDIYKVSKYAALLENLGVGSSEVTEDTDPEAEDIRIYVRDSDTKELIDCAVFSYKVKKSNGVWKLKVSGSEHPEF